MRSRQPSIARGTSHPSQKTPSTRSQMVAQATMATSSQAEKRPVGDFRAAPQDQLHQSDQGRAKGARKKIIRQVCQPRKAPIMAISVTSPKPIASRRRAAAPMIAHQPDQPAAGRHAHQRG